MKNPRVPFFNAQDVHQAVEDALSFVLPLNLMSLNDSLHPECSVMGRDYSGFD